MTTLAISANTAETTGSAPWTSHDWYELFLFLVQSLAIVCAGVFCYFLGPALGIAAFVGGLVAWSKVAKHHAAAKAQLAERVLTEG
jgi:F0F1-type ATP synthase assembly protein I